MTTKATKEKYYIGDLGFKTKKECETYTRNIINSLEIVKITKDHKYFSFFEDLLKNHLDYDDKRGTGIDYFYIQRNPLNSRQYQPMIKRLDGSYISFSWIHCCQFKEPKPIEPKPIEPKPIKPIEPKPIELIKPNGCSVCNKPCGNYKKCFSCNAKEPKDKCRCGRDKDIKYNICYLCKNCIICNGRGIMYLCDEVECSCECTGKPFEDME